MVFDIALSQLLRMFTLEFLKQIGGYLTQGVNQHIEPSRGGPYRQ